MKYEVSYDGGGTFVEVHKMRVQSVLRTVHGPEKMAEGLRAIEAGEWFETPSGAIYRAVAGTAEAYPAHVGCEADVSAALKGAA